MSLRPSLSSIKLQKLRDFFGCQDQSLIKELKESFRDAASESIHADGDRQIELLINEGTAPFKDKPENETLQIIMYLLAERPACERKECEAIFWEEFCGAASANMITVSKRSAPLLSQLVRGRPLLGNKIETTWSFYSWLDKDEASLMFQEILAHKDAQKMFDFEDARDWMQGVVKNKQDVWFFAS